MEVSELGVHGLRATAATNGLEHEADIAKVQAWLGHANLSMARIYDCRQNRRGTHRPKRSSIDREETVVPASAGISNFKPCFFFPGCFFIKN